ncbi:MAG: hypothetical protein ACLQME_11380 [Alphaproteobacteria bacterium]
MSLRSIPSAGLPYRTPPRSWAQWGSLAAKLPLLYLAAAALTAIYVCQDEHIAVHPAWYLEDMPALTYGNGKFGAEELIKQFQNFGGWIEFRPRFLAYFILTLDQYLRFFLYPFWRIPTNFSIMYIPELISVVLFYRTVFNLTSRKNSAQVGTALYVTSLGFTSGLSYMFLAGKPMTNVIFIVIAAIASEMWKKDETKLFIEHSPGHQLIILLTMFIGFNFDEGAFFAPLIAPTLFPSLFVPRDPRRRLGGRTALNLLVYFLPVLCFLLFVLVIVPVITRATYGYDFDFISTVLGTHDPRMHEADYGLAGRFTPTTLYLNFLALLEPSFIPWQLRPYLGWGGQSIVGSLYIGTVVIVAVWVARLGSIFDRRLAFRSLVLLGLFILFSALLNGRHAIIVNGYYYGSAIAVFVSLSLALLVRAASARGIRAQGVALLLVAWPIAIQIDHSVYATSQSQIGYNALAADDYSKNSPLGFVKLDRQRPVSGQELDWIWRMWKAGKLLEIGSRRISPGSLYLVAELYRLDQYKYGPIPSGLMGAETIRR